MNITYIKSVEMCLLRGWRETRIPNLASHFVAMLYLNLVHFLGAVVLAQI